MEPEGTNRTGDDVTKEMTGTAQMAVNNVMTRIESQRQSLMERIQWRGR